MVSLSRVGVFAAYLLFIDVFLVNHSKSQTVTCSLPFACSNITTKASGTIYGDAYKSMYGSETRAVSTGAIDGRGAYSIGKAKDIVTSYSLFCGGANSVCVFLFLFSWFSFVELFSIDDALCSAVVEPLC